jgi:hypothetical protein
MAGVIRERLAMAVGEKMFDIRKSRTLMPWKASPERTEALNYVDVILQKLEEPTAEMLEEAVQAMREPTFEDIADGVSLLALAETAYRAMIKEAMK